ncbi:hypothetical protein JTE90_009409 [Oedothorax gibbosus]|uniref:Uncharacterized protein n=1 Tax=Oedothorax gibbosus TaxID=931172 RepID=A0AAV6VSS2_9ARAC|nr:hypothetical protein JTE90_009409 [Oedothorax gibbosus]
MNVCLKEHSENIVKVLDTADSSSLLFIGQKGSATYLDSQLCTESTFQWDLCSDVQRRLGACRKRRQNSCSVTDAVYLGVSGHYCLSTTNRALHFMRASPGAQWETFRLAELPTVPTCLASSFHSMNKDKNCQLFIGDHKGNIHILTFFYSSTMLFSRKYSLKTQIIRFIDLNLHESYVKWKTIAKVHSDLVNKLEYISPRNLLFSSSCLDVQKNLVSQDLHVSRMNIFHHPQGITCFDTSHQLDKIVSGSKDFLIRIWEIGCCSKAITMLFGHKAVIADVRFHSQGTVVSVCKEGEVRIWSLDSCECLQRFLVRLPTITFPCTFGNSTLHVVPHNDKRILITLKKVSMDLNTEECSKNEDAVIK